MTFEPLSNVEYPAGPHSISPQSFPVSANSTATTTPIRQIQKPMTRPTSAQSERSNAAQLKPTSPPRPLSTRPRTLQPAPSQSGPHIYQPPERPSCFTDLPAEIRVYIYKLALRDVTIHILPTMNLEHQVPHALARTSKQVRSEVLPVIQSVCEIRANVTDFNFDGLITWVNRIRPDHLVNLKKNQDLKIRLCTTCRITKKADSLRKWLHLRADPHRPQPNWKYSGPMPKPKVVSEMRRRARRMTEPRKRTELAAMLAAIGVVPE